MNFTECFKIDGDKINSVEDVAQIIDALDIRLAPDHEAFDQLEPYLTNVKEENQNTYD